MVDLLDILKTWGPSGAALAMAWIFKLVLEQQQKTFSDTIDILITSHVNHCSTILKRVDDTICSYSLNCITDHRFYHQRADDIRAEVGDTK